MGPKALDISSQDNLPIKHGDIVGIENYRETFEGNRMVVYIYIYTVLYPFHREKPWAYVLIKLEATI